MTFKFYCTSEEELVELKSTVGVEAKRHFKGIPTPMTDIADGISIEIPNSAYFADFERMRKSVYRQKNDNFPHCLVEDPNDLGLTPVELPETDREVVLHLAEQVHVTGWRTSDQEFIEKEGTHWVSRWKKFTSNNEVIAWSYIDAREILLEDFISDVEENLSFVPEMEVE